MKPAKAYLNVLRLRLNMRLKRSVLRTYPVIAIIDPTSSSCPLQCPGCPTGLRLGLRKPHLLESELYTHLIDEIGDYLFYIELHNWGEPLLHKQTPEFIRYAKSKDIKVILHTNMSIRLTDEYIRNLVNSGLDELVVSADGATQGTYEKYRRGGNLSLVRNNMERIQAEKMALGAKKPAIIWKFIVFQHNEHEITRVKKVYKDWGADSFIFCRPFMDFNMLEEGFAYSSIPEYGATAYQAPPLSKAGHETVLAQCSFLYEALTLNSDGSVSPCCGIIDENDDFAKYSPSAGFFSAWNSDKFKTARSFFSKSQMPQGQQDKTSDGVANVCQRCRAGFAPWMLEHAESLFRDTIRERASLFVQQNDLRYLPDFLLTLCIYDFPAAVRKVPSYVGRRLAKVKSHYLI
jgi:organic radical activating enzyme